MLLIFVVEAEQFYRSCNVGEIIMVLILSLNRSLSFS